MDAWRTAQQEKDRLIDTLLRHVLHELDPLARAQAAAATEALALGPVAASPAAAAAAAREEVVVVGLADPFEVVATPGVAALFGAPAAKAAAAAMAKPEGNGRANREKAVEVPTLEESCLVPFLEALLANESLLDMERHADLYVTAFQVDHDPSCPCFSFFLNVPALASSGHRPRILGYIL
jgi:hypothetical protein